MGELCIANPQSDIMPRNPERGQVLRKPKNKKNGAAEDPAKSKRQICMSENSYYFTNGGSQAGKQQNAINHWHALYYFSVTPSINYISTWLILWIGFSIYSFTNRPTVTDSISMQEQLPQMGILACKKKATVCFPIFPSDTFFSISDIYTYTLSIINLLTVVSFIPWQEDGSSSLIRPYIQVQ